MTGADKRLGTAFLDDAIVLVQDATMPGDHTSAAIRGGFKGLNAGEATDGVAKEDRVMESPFEDAEKGEGLHTRRLAHQARADGHSEQTVSDRLAEWTAPGSLEIHVNGVEVAREPSEESDIRRGNGSARALPLVAHNQIVEQQARPGMQGQDPGPPHRPAIRGLPGRRAGLDPRSGTF